MVGPEPEDFHHLHLCIYLIHEPMLDMDAARVSALEITGQYLK